MSAGSLKKLAVAHLRGSTQPFSLPFESGRKLTVVYGENGTGKSTICDALEFIGKGKIGSLENRGLGRTEGYWPSIGKKPADILVTLETSAGSCVGKIGTNEVIVSPTNLRPRVEVLRRTQILNLVEARPGEKYAAIQRFIDVSGIEASEAALRKLIDSLLDSQHIAVARLSENQEAIEKAWEIDGKPAPDAFTWAEAQAKIDIKVFAAESKNIESLLLAYQRLKDGVDKIEEASQKVAKTKSEVAKAKEALDQAIENATAGASDEVPILEAATNYLHKHSNLTACPLCESSEKITGLNERIQTRLLAFKALREAQASLKAVEGIHNSTELRFKTESDALGRYVQAFEDLRIHFSWPHDVPSLTEQTPTNIANLPAWVKSLESIAGQWKIAKDNRTDRQKFVANVTSALKTYRQNFQEQEALAKLLPNLNSVMVILQEERRAFTDEVLSGISVNVGTLYEAVHPGEGLDKISLALDPKKRASLEIESSFEGEKSVPPQAYFSESHLDTLGLCVFLALSELDAPQDTILVLDDILASVDEPHVDRLIEMLYTEALKFRHSVITTHYRPWKQKLRWGWFQNGQCQFVELSKWTAANGMTQLSGIPDIERLKLLLAESPPDPQLVCAKAGVILEAALDFLTQLYECSIPRRKGGLYTLGDLLPAIKSKLRLALEVEVMTGRDTAGVVAYRKVSMAPILDELTRIAQLRNVFGCHFNELSFELLESDAISFGTHVLELIEALVDRQAGWPRSKKSGGYWANAGETRKLHPLEQP
jgi:hypothetical protein